MVILQQAVGELSHLYIQGKTGAYTNRITPLIFFLPFNNASTNIPI